MVLVGVIRLRKPARFVLAGQDDVVAVLLCERVLLRAGAGWVLTFAVLTCESAIESSRSVSQAGGECRMKGFGRGN
jgi:hypothetical protein